MSRPLKVNFAQSCLCRGGEAFWIPGRVMTQSGVKRPILRVGFANSNLFHSLGTLKMTVDNHTIPPSLLYDQIDKTSNCETKILVPFPSDDVSTYWMDFISDLQNIYASIFIYITCMNNKMNNLYIFRRSQVKCTIRIINSWRKLQIVTVLQHQASTCVLIMVPVSVGIKKKRNMFTALRVTPL